jgi:hypothetical protein
VLPLLSDAAAAAAANSTAKRKSACGFCRGACVAGRHDVVSCERCPRTFHRRCVQPPSSRRGAEDEDDDTGSSSDEDALMADTFVCGFCSPVVSSSAQCALCHQPPHTSSTTTPPFHLLLSFSCASRSNSNFSPPSILNKCRCRAGAPCGSLLRGQYWQQCLHERHLRPSTVRLVEQPLPMARARLHPLLPRMLPPKSFTSSANLWQWLETHV